MTRITPRVHLIKDHILAKKKRSELNIVEANRATLFIKLGEELHKPEH